MATSRALYQGCQDPRESVILLWCDELARNSTHVRHGTPVRSHQGVGWPLTMFFGRYLHLSYTAQILVLLPWRAYTYKKKQWHYFLFDVRPLSLAMFVPNLNWL